MSSPSITNPESAILGEMPGAEQFFQLGMLYASGRSMPPDMVSAHKWFNIAAMSGCRDAARLRHEIAAEMSETEIAAAQRARPHLGHATLSAAPQAKHVRACPDVRCRRSSFVAALAGRSPGRRRGSPWSSASQRSNGLASPPEDRPLPCRWQTETECPAG
jgi:uncharacterized protein